MNSRRSLLPAAGLALGLMLLTAWAVGDDERTLTVPAGRHDSLLPRLLKVRVKTQVDRTVSFQARFTASAAYLTSDPGNQADWNKLMGITTNRIHHNSIRLGWRWLPGSGLIELGFYGYIRGERISHALTTVPLDTWVDVTLRLHNGGLSATAGPATYDQKKDLRLSPIIPTTTWILETVYFGGDEKAPHDIAVKVRQIAID